jgi:carbon monoxide dehydrogenase subunit G
MQLTHDFTVPASMDETWAALNDIEGIAGCFPGATVTGVEGDSFEGSCKVKLGPIALVYNGAGAFVEKDAENHRMKIEAKGKDKRGNGTAGADVIATMAETGEGTRVTVVTELNITGKPAQFGRGVMQDVSDKLLGQFVDCLSRRLSAPPADETGTETETEDAGGAAAPDTDAAPAAATPGVAEPTPLRPSTSATQSASSGPSARGSDDALDLGATVLPVLARTYWRQALAAVVGLLLLRRILRRR